MASSLVGTRTNTWKERKDKNVAVLRRGCKENRFYFMLDGEAALQNCSDFLPVALQFLPFCNPIFMLHLSQRCHSSLTPVTFPAI